MSYTSDPSGGGDSDKNIVLVQAVAVSTGTNLFVSVVQEKEIVWFIGEYTKDGTDGSKKVKSDKERKANGKLEFPSSGSAPGDFEFTATKDEDTVTITFTSGGEQTSVQFKGEGDIRVGKGKGVTMINLKGKEVTVLDARDPSSSGGDITTQNATSKSRGDQLFVRVSDSYDSGKKKLTFVGKYAVTTETDDSKLHAREVEGVFTPSGLPLPEESQWAEGALTFLGPGFAEGDHSNFKATKVKNFVNRNYDVTITFTGQKKVNGVLEAISAEFKGKGDIRVGEGTGKWELIKDA